MEPSVVLVLFCILGPALAVSNQESCIGDKVKNDCDPDKFLECKRRFGSVHTTVQFQCLCMPNTIWSTGHNSCRVIPGGSCHPEPNVHSEPLCLEGYKCVESLEAPGFDLESYHCRPRKRLVIGNSSRSYRKRQNLNRINQSRRFMKRRHIKKRDTGVQYMEESETTSSNDNETLLEQRQRFRPRPRPVVYVGRPRPVVYVGRPRPQVYLVGGRPPYRRRCSHCSATTKTMSYVIIGFSLTLPKLYYHCYHVTK